MKPEPSLVSDKTYARLKEVLNGAAMRELVSHAEHSQIVADVTARRASGTLSEEDAIKIGKYLLSCKPAYTTEFEPIPTHVPIPNTQRLATYTEYISLHALVNQVERQYPERHHLAISAANELPLRYLQKELTQQELTHAAKAIRTLLLP